MKIPKKITPDRIKDSIVEVRYNSKIPFEAIIGILYQSMVPQYTYTNRPLGRQQFPLPVPPTISQEITLSLGGVNLFSNDKIKVQLIPNSIVFNCVGDYIGWIDFKAELEKILSIFIKSIKVDSFTRIGIRYITEYPNLDLVDCVKFNFTFGMAERKSEKYSFKTEFKLDDYRVILSLNNKLPVVKEANKSPDPISIIDLDLIKEETFKSDLKTLMGKLDNMHSKEKEVFFNLLKEDFLKSLNPEY